MTDYTKATNFTSKDSLSTGNPLKIVKGTEIDTEFNNIQTAIATKTDNANAAITGGYITGITDLAVADGGTGASDASTARTNLSAAKSGANSDITSITGLTTALTASQGGTGLSAPGTSGNVLTSNGSVWTSSAPSGVTSLNGVTGAITNTGYGDIGSYFIGFGAINTDYEVGATISGSSLNKYNNTNHTALGTADIASPGFGYVNSFTSAGLTGTWRAMSRAGTSSGGILSGYAAACLWVRIN
jgi:hypothetical protein